MSIWDALWNGAAALKVNGALGALARSAFTRLPRRTDEPPRAVRRRQVAFTIAAIALAAKMARADGYASEGEFATFERLFRVPEAERDNARRFYQLAKSSTAGFEVYATQAASLLGPGSPVLEDLLEALMLIAVTDGVHPEEVHYLDEVAARLGFDPGTYARIKARHILPSADNPYVVLGVPPGSDLQTVRTAYRTLVKAYHPDRHMAEGTPPEFIRVAEDRMAAINAAYAALARHGGT